MNNESTLLDLSATDHQVMIVETLQEQENMTVSAGQENLELVLTTDQGIILPDNIDNVQQVLFTPDTIATVQENHSTSMHELFDDVPQLGASHQSNDDPTTSPSIFNEQNLVTDDKKEKTMEEKSTKRSSNKGMSIYLFIVEKVMIILMTLFIAYIGYCLT